MSALIAVLRETLNDPLGVSVADHQISQHVVRGPSALKCERCLNDREIDDT